MDMNDKLDQENANTVAFIEWARTQAVPLTIPRQDENYADLHFLPSIIGNKHIVAVGESAHYLYEWNRWRARLFKYLALEHGFTTFVLESAFVEGRIVHEYVAGVDHDWESVALAINNVWGVWAEINELIRWMRDWNKNPHRPRELRFYGMDGSGNWAHAGFAYQAVQEYVSRVDAALNDEIKRRFEKKLEGVTLENRAAISARTFRELVGEAGLLVSQIEQLRIEYVERTSRDDYDWALRSAEILRDILQALAQTDRNFDIGFRQFWNVRDVSMTRSLQWIREREGPHAGIVVGAHNTHLQRYPVRVQRAPSMGSYFTSRFGHQDILLIGAASDRSLKGEPPNQDSNQAAYACIGPDCFLLDLRDAPAQGPVANWLGVERPDRSNLRYQPVCAGKAWDCLLFHRTLSTATVERPAFMHAEQTESPNNLRRFAGRYFIYGFLAAKNTLDVYYESESLYTDGRDDTSGEVFPPYRAKIHYCQDGRFRWTVWPSILEFHETSQWITVSVMTPGRSVYRGERVGDTPKR